MPAMDNPAIRMQASPLPTVQSRLEAIGRFRRMQTKIESPRRILASIPNQHDPSRRAMVGAIMSMFRRPGGLTGSGTGKRPVISAYTR
jgi:hypothetical protein